MRKLYSVHFLDCRDGGYNHKLLEADCAEDVYAYMYSLGHTDVEVEER